MLGVLIAVESNFLKNEVFFVLGNVELIKLFLSSILFSYKRRPIYLPSFLTNLASK